MAVNTSQKKLLIEMDDVTLAVPVTLSSDRSVLKNPLWLVTNFYKFGDRRKYTDLLSNVNFKLYSGERVGVMGLNGAGKSTFLKLLGAIYYPSSGTVSCHGSVKGLFDLSLGTNPDATGLENIILRALQMGLSLKEAKAMIPEVVEFSNLGDDVYKPLGTYSAGMRMRLVLSVSTLINPDVLLLDEWIGAGDQAFSEKIKGRMEGMINQSKSLVLATHNFQLIKAFCTRAIVIHEGKLIFDGDLHEAHSVYRVIYKAHQS